MQWSSHYKQEVFTRLSSRKRSLHLLLLVLRDSSSSFNYPPDLTADRGEVAAQEEEEEEEREILQFRES